MSKTKTIAEPTLLDLLIVKQGKAPKLSIGADGEITYQVALSPVSVQPPHPCSVCGAEG